MHVEGNQGVPDALRCGKSAGLELIPVFHPDGGKSKLACRNQCFTSKIIHGTRDVDANQAPFAESRAAQGDQGRVCKGSGNKNAASMGTG